MMGLLAAEPGSPEGLVRVASETYALTLFVNGATELSARAIAAARYLCDTHLVGRYQLSVVDIHDASVEARVLAVPTLVRDSPLPVRRVVGDLADIEKVLQALEISGAKITSSGSD